VIFSIKESLYLILMIAGRTFTIELRVVIEEIRVDLIQDPRLLHDDLLHEYEERR